MKQEGLETIAATLTLAAMQGMKREESAADANAQVVADAVVRLYEHIYIRLANSKAV